MSFELDDELVQRLKALKEEDGIFVSEQLRRAVLLWLESRGAAPVRRKTKSRRK